MRMIEPAAFTSSPPVCGISPAAVVNSNAPPVTRSVYELFCRGLLRRSVITAPRPCTEFTKLELSCTVVRPKSMEGVCDGLCACTSEGMQARARIKMALLRERFIVVYLGETQESLMRLHPNDHR